MPAFQKIISTLKQIHLLVIFMVYQNCWSYKNQIKKDEHEFLYTKYNCTPLGSNTVAKYIMIVFN